jgi:hypothetical protein
VTETVGVYPGTFDPPTVAHVAIAEAALLQGGLDRLDLVVSESPLGKIDADVAALDARVRLLDAIAEARPWLRIIVNKGGLISDIAAGYDAVVLGADKWQQVVDPAWYGGSVEARDEAVRLLPRVLIAPRDGFVTERLPPGALVLDLPSVHGSVSSTGAREGRIEWVALDVAGMWKPRGG